MDASQKTVTSIKLTDEQRRQVAQDLGMTDRMEKIPSSITIAGVKSADVKGSAIRGGGAAAVAVID